MNDKIKRGGRRPGAGRKPLENKKEPVTVYLCRETAQKMKEDKEFREAMLAMFELAAKMKVGNIKKKMFDDFVITGEAMVDYKTPAPESFNGPKFPDNFKEDEAGQMQLPKVVVITLEKIREMCPKELTGIERTIWIDEQRKKYGI